MWTCKERRSRPPVHVVVSCLHVNPYPPGVQLIRPTRAHPHTVHKLNDCLHPMECIPETQFTMRSKIHLAVLLHLRCKCEREEDYSHFEQILI